MKPQPLALGYLRADGGPDALPLTKAQTESRRAAIQLHADGESLTLKEVYVEDAPGAQRALSRLVGETLFYLATNETLDVVIIFEQKDLGATSMMQTKTREKIEDLGVRIEVVQ